MYSVDSNDEKTTGNAVHRVTSTKISQTWFASQTGPIECSMRPRTGAPRSGPPASRSQMPPPKSAPANSAYAVTPIQSSMSYTHLRAHETRHDLVCRLLLE